MLSKNKKGTKPMQSVTYKNKHQCGRNSYEEERNCETQLPAVSLYKMQIRSICKTRFKESLTWCVVVRFLTWCVVVRFLQRKGPRVWMRLEMTEHTFPVRLGLGMTGLGTP